MVRMYNVDKNYFEKIDTEDKAYWLGFIYADGCVTKDKSSLILDLSEKDSLQLERLNQCMLSNYEIKHYTEKGLNYVRIKINSRKLCRDLIDKGCPPHKTHILKFPTTEQVPNDLIKHFIRGYFDGDGCIYAKMRNSKSRKNLALYTEFNILGTKELLEGIAKSLPTDSISIYKRKNKSVFTLRVYGKNDIINIMNYMYSNAKIYMQRKYEKFIEVKNYMNLPLIENN